MLLESEQYGMVIGHGGSTSAYWSFLFHYPESGVTVAVAFNGDTENSDAYRRLLKLVLEIVDIAFE